MIKQNTKSCIHVGLYGSGLFNFGSYVHLPTLFACFFGFNIPTSSFILMKMFFTILSLYTVIKTKCYTWKTFPEMHQGKPLQGNMTET